MTLGDGLANAENYILSHPISGGTGKTGSVTALCQQLCNGDYECAPLQKLTRSDGGVTNYGVN